MKNMPATAVFGSPLIFFFVCSAALFLIPTALISAELSAAFPEKGGIYRWVSCAFGHRLAMTAVWLQWSNTMVWYPTMLSFIAGSLAYLICPDLAGHKFYLLSCILVVFWGVTWINLKGIHASSRFTNISAWIGTIFPMTLLILLGIVWLIRKEPIQISLQPRDLLPSLNNFDSWSALIAVMASFLGIELSGVHANEVDQPNKNFPKAIFLGAFCVFLALSLSSLSIAIVLPEKEINLITGVMQVFSNFFDLFGLGAFTPLLALAIAFGSIGTMVNWLIAPAKGLFDAAEEGFLPPFFTRKNAQGVAVPILLIQAVLVSLFSIVFLFLASANEFFWLLTALSTELYMLMYILMFCTGLKLHNYQPDSNAISRFRIPNGWIRILTSLGFASCLITIIVAFVPPPNIDTQHPLRYLGMIGVANLVALAPLLFFFSYQKKRATPQII